VKQLLRTPITIFCCTLMFVLTSCTKPLPSITVQSGTKSVHAQALCWNDSDQNKLRDCLTSLATNQNLVGATIQAPAGKSVGISVDPKATEFGWQALVNGTPLFSTPRSSTYYRFEVPASATGAQTSLQIVSFGPENSIRGVWLFRLSD